MENKTKTLFLKTREKKTWELIIFGINVAGCSKETYATMTNNFANFFPLSYFGDEKISKEFVCKRPIHATERWIYVYFLILGILLRIFILILNQIKCMYPYIRVVFNLTKNNWIYDQTLLF